MKISCLKLGSLYLICPFVVGENLFVQSIDKFDPDLKELNLRRDSESASWWH